jgi:DNA repair exonuclease SbcCD ATPase subunit
VFSLRLLIAVIFVAALLDLDAVQAFARSLNDELRSLKLQIEKQNVLVESCKERLAFKREQSSLIDRQRSQFDRILASYTEDIQSSYIVEAIVYFEYLVCVAIDEEEELAAIQDDIRAALDEIEHQQAQAKSPQFDINALRKQRRDINSEFQQIKTQFNKDRVLY